MPACFRIGDPWDCGDTQGQGSPDVITNNIPQSRLTDLTMGHCYPPIPITIASPNVFANNLGYGRVGDYHPTHCCGTSCHDGHCAAGSPNVFANSGDGPPAPIPPPPENVSVYDTLTTSNDDVMDSVPTHVIAAARADAGLPPTQGSAPASAQDTTPATQPGPLPADCVDIASHDDNFPASFPLSPNFTLGQLTLTPSQQPNQKVQAQAGLTVQEIVCNLRYLCLNILEPYLAAYGSVRINSGFRLIQNNSARKISQHCTGQAVDIGFPGSVGTSEYWDRALLLKNQLPYDQYILEYKNFGWYHLSFNKNGGRADATKIMSADLNSAPTAYQQGLLKLR
jgi:hypothetical protein